MDNLWNLIGGGAVATVATSGRALGSNVVAVVRGRPKDQRLALLAVMVFVVGVVGCVFQPGRGETTVWTTTVRDLDLRAGGAAREGLDAAGEEGRD